MITEPWQDDPLLMNGKYDGCATKDNADLIMMMQDVTPTLAGEKYSGGSGMNKILCWLGIHAWQITHYSAEYSIVGGAPAEVQALRRVGLHRR